jgi:signal transduction histidine kinase
MLKSDAVADGDHHIVITSLAPGPAQKRFALCIVLCLLVALYLIIGPLAGIQLGEVTAFVAVYATAMFVTDAITAILLYAQYSILRSRAVLVIASGYLFAALIVVPYTLTFPDVLTPAGSIGGLQTSAWLYIIWHTGFPMFVIGYALMKGDDPGKRGRSDTVRFAIFRSIGWTIAAAAAATYLCISGEEYLPEVMLDSRRFGPDWPYLVGLPITILCMTALVILWFRRRSILDLWLMVVMSLFLIEVPVSNYPMPTRYSTGWYAVRVIGFLASSTLLTVLLYEITTLYARLLGATLGQRREREARLMTGDAVAASIAHELRQPLTAMVTTADAGLRFLDRELPNPDKAKEAFRRIVADGHRAGTLIGDIRNHFKSDLQERTSFPVHDLIQEAIALASSELERHRIIVQPVSKDRNLEITGNRVQLLQVLLNLIVNAVDAMSTQDEPRVMTVGYAADEDQRVLVSIADTGAGVGAQDSDRLFNPLFTTKPDGMGMGLSICRSIVEAHDGRLWFAPNQPRGAVFNVMLHGHHIALSEA